MSKIMYSNREACSIFKSIIIESKSGTCDRLQVGAAFVHDEHGVLGCGHNARPKNFRLKDISCTSHGHVFNESGGCIGTVHAEMNALIQLYRSRRFYSVTDFSLFVTHMSCYYCAKMIVQFGITDVYFINDYVSLSSYGSGSKLYKNYGVKLHKVRMTGRD